MMTCSAINMLTVCENGDSRGGVHDAWSFRMWHSVFLKTVAKVPAVPAASFSDTERNTFIRYASACLSDYTVSHLTT